MKIEVNLSIGYPTAGHEDILEIDDEEVKDMTPKEREEYLWEVTKEWANEYIDYWYKEIKED